MPKHHLRWPGVALIILGLLLILGMGSYIYAQDGDEEAEYVGQRECSGCHRELGRDHGESLHALTLQDADEDTILADFSQGEDLRMVQFPGEDATRPFDTDDIELVMGAGRYVQRYVYEIDRGEYAVFPAEWSVVDGEWKPYAIGESWPDSPEYDWVQNCAGCHTTGLNVRRGRWEDDGVQCEACHGPGSIHAEIADDAGSSPSDREYEEIRGSIVLIPDAQICGQCHSQGTEPDDSHPYPVDYRPGMDLLDDPFDLVPNTSEEYWWPTRQARLPNMQFNEWLMSAHVTTLRRVQASDNAADECLVCHSADYRSNQTILAAHEAGEREGDPPEAITVDTAEYSTTCSLCHSVHESVSETGVSLSAPTPYELCTQCHTDDNFEDGVHYPHQQMFEGTTIIEGIEGVPSSHFVEEDGPDCATCHMQRVPTGSYTLASHTLVVVMPGDDIPEGLEDSCMSCHEEQVSVEEFLTLITELQDLTESRLETAQDALAGDEPLWVTQVLDFVENDGSNGMHNYLYVDALLDSVEMELGISTPAEDSSSVPAPPEMDAAETAIDETTTPVAKEATPSSAEEGVEPIARVIMGGSVVLMLVAAWFFFFKKETTA